MKSSHQENSRLRIQKFFTRAKEYCKNWIEGTTYFDSEVLFDILCYAAVNKCSTEQAGKHLKELGTAPSGETVRNQIKNQYKELDQAKITNLMSQLFQYLVRRLPQFRGNRDPTAVLAIDLHDEEYYGDDIFDDNGNRLVFKTPHGKSDKSLRYGTLAIVKLGNIPFPLTIGFIACHVGQSRKEVVKQLLDQNRLGMRINRLLLDGGFASLGVLKFLELERKLPWITRGNYSKKKNYLGEVNGNWFPYKLKDEFEIPAYLIKHEGKKLPVLLLCSRFWTPSPEKIKQIYKMRFRIENTYRQARKMKIYTTTTDFRMRWIFYALAHFLEILWQLLRYSYVEEEIDNYLLSQFRFTFMISRYLEVSIEEFRIRS